MRLDIVLKGPCKFDLLIANGNLRRCVWRTEQDGQCRYDIGSGLSSAIGDDPDFTRLDLDSRLTYNLASHILCEHRFDLQREDVCGDLCTVRDASTDLILRKNAEESLSTYVDTFKALSVQEKLLCRPYECTTVKIYEIALGVSMCCRVSSVHFIDDPALCRS